MHDYDWRAESRRDWWVLLLLIAVFLGGLALYPRLPEQLPSHWNVQGQVDGYMARQVAVFFLPGIALAVYLFMLFIPMLDPRRSSYAFFSGAYRLLRAAIVLFMSGLYAATLAHALGSPVDVSVLVRLGVGVLFVLIGNVMGQVRSNYFVGIRTPWTLENPEVWRRTHRVAGRVWVICGLIIMAGAFLPRAVAFVILMISLAVVVGFSFIYSYLVYRQVKGA